METIAKITQRLPDLARVEHAGDPAWPGYVEAFATADECRAHFPGIAALALEGRRDWYTAERLRIVGADFITITYAAMLALCREAKPDAVERVTADAVLNLLAWHELNDRPADTVDEDAGTIPF